MEPKPAVAFYNQMGSWNYILLSCSFIWVARTFVSMKVVPLRPIRLPTCQFHEIFTYALQDIYLLFTKESPSPPSLSSSDMSPWVSLNNPPIPTPSSFPNIVNDPTPRLKWAGHNADLDTPMNSFWIGNTPLDLSSSPIPRVIIASNSATWIIASLLHQ